MSGAGVVTGGWEFVWAAYVLTAVILGGYAVWLIARYRAERARARRAASEVTEA